MKVLMTVIPIEDGWLLMEDRYSMVHSVLVKRRVSLFA